MGRLMSAAVAAGATLVLVAGAAHAATAPPATPAAVASATARPGGLSATPQERAVAYVAPSIVYISSVWSGKVYDRQNERFLNDGEPFRAPYSCTGFAISPNGYTASAGHCVEYDDATAALFLVMAPQRAQPAHRLAASDPQKARPLPDPPASPAPPRAPQAEESSLGALVWRGAAGVVVVLMAWAGVLLWLARRRAAAPAATAGVTAGLEGFAPAPASANGVAPSAAHGDPSAAPAVHAVADPAEQPAEARTLLAQASLCGVCRAPMAPDQRFCGSCGQPRGGS